MIVSQQIRAARAALRWSAQKLADESGLSLATIQRMEAGEGVPTGLASNVQEVQSALQRAGIEFIERGLRWQHG